MKQKVMFITIVLLALSNTIILYNYCNLKKEVLSYKENYKKSKKNMISMMLETDTNSKTYIQSTDSAWPSDGYMFNEEMSKCEQGSKLSWDDTNKKVVMEGNSSDKCYVFFDKYSPITINNYSITSSGNKITITIDATSGTGTISKYYYSKDDGVTYIESTSNNYVFTSLDKGTYKIKAYVEDSNGKKSTILSKTIEITTLTIADYIISQYTGTQGENGLYYHESSLENSDKSNSYRYAGSNPNNYICFGSKESTCPEDNLYRIIGVFGEEKHGISGKNLVEIIKSTTLGNYQWNDRSSNDWASSVMESTLNVTYLTNTLSGYEDKIEKVLWKTSGLSRNGVTTQVIYNEEIVNATSTHSAKVGLMYPSDYGYAASPKYWTYKLYASTETEDYRAAAGENWLLYGVTNEWTISIDPTSTNAPWNIGYTGQLYNHASPINKWITRPAFYLASTVTYESGTGTSTDPYRVK